ncbi:SDR family oxidoreductase [Devosia sp. Leaf420]|uniref:SDR family oxidoreductase n=1 Tax=Devosia sp. Leaf420 TaxID=1736374 RepID=UPI001910007E|nr:SDR family oxidoreductase [Devosia sp. Leaf420]
MSSRETWQRKWKSSQRKDELMILVTGATGGIGGELCKLLAESGVPFRAMARKPDQIDRLRERGWDVVQADFSKPSSIVAAAKGCDQMFLISPPTEEQVQRETDAIDAAKQAGVARVVKISASDSNVRSPVPWAKSHALIDHHLRASGLNWTILKPTAFMQNFLWFKEPISKGFLPQVTGNGSVSWVDTRDVARVAKSVLIQDGHDGATYFLTGPQTLDMKTIAGRLSELVGHKVRYLNLPTPAFKAILRLAGNSNWMARGLVVQFADVVAGHHDIDPTFEIERLTGAPAHDFESFAAEHIGAFRKAA